MKFILFYILKYCFPELTVLGLQFIAFTISDSFSSFDNFLGSLDGSFIQLISVKVNQSFLHKQMDPVVYI